jgi:hypothetical protein
MAFSGISACHASIRAEHENPKRICWNSADKNFFENGDASCVTRAREHPS